jgi:hypothetical protein
VAKYREQLNIPVARMRKELWNFYLIFFHGYSYPSWCLAMASSLVYLYRPTVQILKWQVCTLRQ